MHRTELRPVLEPVTTEEGEVIEGHFVQVGHQTVEVPVIAYLVDGEISVLDADVSPPMGAHVLSEAEIAEIVQRPRVPRIVSIKQARLALLAAGKLSDVEAAIAQLPSPQREAAEIEWEYATEVHRDSQLVTTLASALQLDLDALFVAAGAIP